LIEIARFYKLDLASAIAPGGPRAPQPHYAVVIVPAGESDAWLVDLGGVDEIDAQVVVFHTAVKSRDVATAPASERVAEPAERDGTDLRARIFDRLLPYLSGRARLFISPDGELTRLAFGALPMADGRRLIDAYDISYLSTGRDLLRFSASSAGPFTDPLVGADPDFDLVTPVTPVLAEETVESKQSRDHNWANRFTPLAGARAEGERVAQILGVEPLLGPNLLKGKIKAWSSPQIIHLATHGFFLRDQARDPNEDRTRGNPLSYDVGQLARLARTENPLLRSGLVLAGANTWLSGGNPGREADDGLLTAEDVSGLDLARTELAVLSACESGLGDVRAGEGVFGLRRAFVLAGAQTVVMSLWKVPDEETRELMEQFYRRVLTGEGRAEALRNAQLALKAEKPEPFWWGAFICQGNPGPLVTIGAKAGT
jgi:hypothetical protein